MIWYHMHCVSSLPALRDRQGAALIPIIIAIVIISAIGAVLLSLSSVGTFNSLLGNSADRAYYLAESGFRYAAMTYRHGGAGELDAINNQPFTVGANQEFTLHLRTQRLEVTGGGGSNTLNTEVAFGWVPEIPTGNTSGYLKIGSANEREFNHVDIPDPEGTQVNFDKAAGNWNVSAGEPVRFAARSDGSAVVEGGDLQLQPGTAEDFFPKHNGRFTADGNVYQYKTRDSTNNMLRSITRVDGPWTPPSLNNNEAIVLNDFVEVNSTGSYGQGYFGAKRDLTYHVPFSEATPGGQFHDTFNNKDNWIEENNGDSAEGAHEIQGQNGNALAVTEISRIGGTELDSSLIEFDRAAAGLNLEEQWSSSGNYLSYDAQVKIRAENEPVFMDGISFRLHENLNSYGISLLKAEENNSDGIPNSIVPQPPGQTTVVLWERSGNDWSTWTWLAYHVLPLDSHVGPRIFFQDDMESGESKWDSYGGEWGLTTSDSHSPTHSWQNQSSSAGCGTVYSRLDSQDFDLSEASNPELSFWHHYSIGGGSNAELRISTDQGDNWDTLDAYNGNQNRWTKQTIDLSEYAGQPDVRIRFGIEIGGGQAPDWYVDDVKVHERGLDWPTLLISVKEAESISFSQGDTQINAGDTISQEDGFGNVTASGTVYTESVLDSGSWSGNDAAGDILIRNTSGTFQAGDPLLVNGTECATADSINGRQNYIRAYIGDPNEHGTPGTNPLDRQRLGNPRGDVNWPPRNADDTDGTNDYFTLVQWDETDTSVTQIGTGNEQDAVIRTNTFTTETFPDTRPELGLHTWGWGSVDGEPASGEVPDIYFDDFAVRLAGGTASGGFAPAIQESAAGE